MTYFVLKLLGALLSAAGTAHKLLKKPESKTPPTEDKPDPNYPDSVMMAETISRSDKIDWALIVGGFLITLVTLSYEQHQSEIKRVNMQIETSNQLARAEAQINAMNVLQSNMNVLLPQAKSSTEAAERASLNASNAATSAENILEGMKLTTSVAQLASSNAETASIRAFNILTQLHITTSVAELASSNAQAASASASNTLSKMSATTDAANNAAAAALKASTNAESALHGVSTNVEATLRLASRFQRLNLKASYQLALNRPELTAVSNGLYKQFNIGKTNEMLAAGYWFKGRAGSNDPIVLLNQRTSSLVTNNSTYLNPLLKPTFKLTLCPTEDGTNVVFLADDSKVRLGPILTYIPPSGTQTVAFLNVTWLMTFPRDSWEYSRHYSTFEQWTNTWLNVGFNTQTNESLWSNLSSPDFDLFIDEELLDVQSIKAVSPEILQIRLINEKKRVAIKSKIKGAKPTYKIVPVTNSIAEPDPESPDKLINVVQGLLVRSPDNEDQKPVLGH